MAISRYVLLFVKFKFKTCLFTHTDSAVLSMERETTHIYVCW